MYLKRKSVYDDNKKSRRFSKYLGVVLTVIIILILVGYAKIAFALPFIVEGAAKVIDGDTIHIQSYKMRLAAIDAPELAQKCEYLKAPWDCGIAARNNLIAKINNNVITCKAEKKDLYNRYIATCFLEDEDLNMWMVLNGYATAYSKYSKVYLPAEVEAKENKVGIWSSSFQNPAEYRKAKKQPKVKGSKNPRVNTK
jgi:endonuclease YncB( thermonuclease family)